ncbi:MAG: DUF5320 domain-containing protein [Thermodesulfobacteriota bacterium]
MPRFDGTGPWGAGPGSGWGRGPCGTGRRRGFGAYGGGGYGPGGWGRGRFGGRGRGGWGYGPGPYGPFGYGGAPAYGAPPDEAQALRDEEAYLKDQLDAVQQRLSEVEGSQT